MTPLRGCMTLSRSDLYINQTSNGVYPVRARIIIKNKIRRHARRAGALTG